MKNKTVKKRLIKNAADKLTKLFKPNDKFSSKNIVLAYYCVHDKV